MKFAQNTSSSLSGDIGAAFVVQSHQVLFSNRHGKANQLGLRSVRGAKIAPIFPCWRFKQSRGWNRRSMRVMMIQSLGLPNWGEASLFFALTS